MEEKKVIIKLKKEPLKSEREEIKEKRKHKISIFILCFLLILSGFGLGYSISYVKYKNYQKSVANTKMSEIKQLINGVWLYKNEYDNLDTLLEDKAYYGMTDFQEDPYTTYMSKQENEVFINGINMDYVGIGVQYYSYESEAIITRVFKDSPAENAGIRVGDIIRKIDGKSIENASTDEIKEMVIGTEGSTVDITVEREKQEHTIKVVRGSVDSTVYLDKGDDYVILYIMSFGENTANECIKYLEDCSNYNKIIIDIRDNSGGLQTSVEELAGLFVGNDVVYMKQIYGDGHKEEARTKSAIQFTNFKKFVILMNNNTASAAEVFALCMKEKVKDVTLVGENSFGKGVVQSRYNLSDGSTLKITTSKWTSPNDVSINGEGIKPDIEVKLDDIFYLNVPEMKDDEEYKLDDVSSAILSSQKAMQYLGYDCSRSDGYFDRNFQNVLNQFKADHEFATDGILNKETYDKLLSEVAYIYSTSIGDDAQMQKAKEIVKNG